ncbi:unnamed protein product, partial [Rotaria magnacalcarata]
MVREEMYDFKIKLKDIELLQEKVCHCDNEVVDSLNKVIVFNPTYSDFVNSVLHNHEINVSNRGDIVPNLILNPIITNVQFPKFTVAKHCFSNKSIIYKGTTIGSVTSPLCKVIDADSPIRLNGSLAPIDEASSRIISWTTGTGRYSLKSLPQGFVNSPMLFSAAISQAFGEVLSPMSLPITTTVNGVKKTEMVCKQRAQLYIDDVFTSAEDLATMYTVTELILQKMVKHGL